MRLSRLAALATMSASLTLVLSGTALAAERSTVGYDVSYPQCGERLPRDAAFGIVGVSDGLAYGENPCLAEQYSWASRARRAPAFYMNTGNPGAGAARVDWYAQNGPLSCSAGEEANCAYNYGYNAAQAAFSYARSQTSGRAVRAAAWWLDVETSNSWSTDTSLNVADIQGSIEFLGGAGVRAVGVYSTGYQWDRVTGGVQLDGAVPNWLAGAADEESAAGMCSSSFSGGRVELVQYGSGGLDADDACP